MKGEPVIAHPHYRHLDLDGAEEAHRAIIAGERAGRSMQAGVAAYHRNATAKPRRPDVQARTALLNRGIAIGRASFGFSREVRGNAESEPMDGVLVRAGRGD